MSSLSGYIFARSSRSLQVSRIKFYGVPTNLIHVESSVSLCLEPFNPHDSNCIAVWIGSVMLSQDSINNIELASLIEASYLLRIRLESLWP